MFNISEKQLQDLINKKINESLKSKKTTDLRKKGGYIKKYNKGEGGQVVLANGTQLDVARRRKEELMDMLQKVATRI